MSCLLFKQFLERCGYIVATAQDSDACIQRLQRGPKPDVLVLSWELPPFGGHHVLNWMQDNGINGLSVVAMTCGQTPDDLIQEPDTASVMFVHSPLQLLELLNAVQTQVSAPRDNWRTLNEVWKKSSSRHRRGGRTGTLSGTAERCGSAG